MRLLSLLQQKTAKRLLSFGIIFAIVLSVFFVSDIVSSVYIPVSELKPVAESTITPTVEQTTQQPPTGIYIPRINKRLPIQAGIVTNNQWQLFDSSVAWLSTSSVPQEGNVILYAHNWKSLWRDLYQLQPGDIIEVEQHQQTHTYAVTESRAVSKYDIESILQTENMLTMYTCEGTFDEKRRVVYAKPL